MNSIQEKYRDAGLVIIGVNMDADRSEADKFLQDYPARFQIIYNPSGELARARGNVGEVNHCCA